MRIAISCVLALAPLGPAMADEASTIAIAKSYSDGGGYEWKGTGVPRAIVFRGETILEKGQSTYCSGFTFAVVMKAAERRGLLTDKSPAEVKRFQRQWYGATKESAETQCVMALEQLGIGRQITPERAEPGDFLQLWRTNKSGHSVVFLGWVEQRGKKVGFKYRSSQPSTSGIGDRVEYFAGVPGRDGKVDAARLYFGRLAASAASK